ncbi:MAG: hypothetical protein PHZ19_08760, partial [Candidatus Thermoplasmatota archaeon]|nr:hypothetical protein [Candidatus Thermoplasmatota archaeon]
MKNRIAAVAVCGLLAAAGAVLLAGRGAADWEEGDDHKMHFPQLPDPQGWDVNATWPLNILADDWNCTESGPVTDIHFWGSWRHDLVGDIHGFFISIWSNNPGDPQGGIPSFPEALLWEAYITDFKAIDAGFGAQAWYEPEPDILYPGDHEMYFQYNIINITDPFWQEYGTIYWLSISANISTPGTFWGWKTSIYTNTYDDAFWGYYDPTGGGITWAKELYKDYPSVSMDLAFVITGTPCCNKDWNYWSGWPNIWLIPGGNAGIGTNTPTDKLHVKGNLRVQGSTTSYLFFADAVTERIGIGTNTPSDLFHVSGGLVR